MPYRTVVVLVLSLVVLSACNRGRAAIDGGPSVSLTDSGTPPGTDGGPITGTDGGPITGTDSGPTTGDPCQASMAAAISTVGCNGGFMSGTPAPNGPAGTCTGGDMTMPGGSCSGSALCSGAAGASGWCFPTCTPGLDYVSRGGCPTGFRCFDLTDFDLCFRDCDASHACPSGMMCDGEGSCVPPG